MNLFISKIHKIIRIIYSFIYYLFTFYLFKNTHFSNYIAPSATVANKYRKKLGKNFSLYPFSQLRGDFECGNNVIIGYGCSIYSGVTMGNDIMIGPNCLITGGGHGIDIDKGPMIFQDSPELKKVKIDDDVWIGGNSVILPGNQIGTGSIIGAGSVVVSDIPPFAVVGGNPAKILKYRN